MDPAIDASINFFDTADNRRLSAYHIRRACEASLRRLQTDHIWRSGGTTRS
jgi:aryl-alcohol dehydrogenase-like predicted oxidoreductase